MVELVFLSDTTFLDYDNYVVYPDGQIYSFRTHKFLKSHESGGYIKVSLQKDGISKKFRIHRLVATVYLPNPKGLTDVNHKDRNKANNNVGNLEWISRRDNNLHAVKTGKKNTGVDVYQFTKKGELVGKYKSTSEASRLTRISKSGILGVLNGKRIFCKGFYWSKIPKYDPRDHKGYGKHVEQICTDTGQIINTFKSILEAQRVTGIHNSTISGVCLGNRKSAGGYSWRYIVKEDLSLQREVEEWEEWIVLDKYPLYRISRDGRVFSEHYKRIMNPTATVAGYMRIQVRTKERKKVTIGIHILVALAYIPNPCNYPIVNHLDCNKLNNREENLEWTTYSGNTSHYYNSKT